MCCEEVDQFHSRRDVGLIDQVGIGIGVGTDTVSRAVEHRLRRPGLDEMARQHVVIEVDGEDPLVRDAAQAPT